MKKYKYCCIRFQESVEEEIIIKAEGYDETEWYLNNGPHLYFCPFCGTNIKGKGYGEYDEKTPKDGTIE
jgi:hypothetical protein